MDAHDRSQLVLDWQDQRASLSGDAEALVLGAADDAQISIPGTFTSKHHACIERRNEDFVLVDHSTNGTFVQTEDEHITFVRRGEMRLWGSGWISLGEPLTPQAAIRFENI
ncbi:MAG: FHA domain-containing protein [Gammaproteobacteria bacterium]|nr:FHA domain-containing protein [Gammaproteobacteria bacterium]